MNQIVSMEALEREELAQLERRAKENVRRREAAEAQKEAMMRVQEQEMQDILQRARERQSEHETATMIGGIGGIALALGCVAFDALWVLLVALGWVLGAAWKAVRG